MLFWTGTNILILSGDKALAGVNSFVCASLFDLKADSDYGDFSGATRVTWFTPWIAETMANYTPPPSTLEGTSPANLTAAITPIPEPAMLLAVAGIALLLIARRRG